MGGIWKVPPPPRPGTYVNFETTGTEAVTAGNTGVVGLPITADWGPVNEFVLLGSDSQLQDVYGPVSLSGKARTYQVQEAFRGGASQVLTYRMTDGTETYASVDLYDEQTSAVSASAVVTTVTSGGTGVNEVQRIAFSGQIEGGTFTISSTGTQSAPVSAVATSALPYNASAATIQTALQALAPIGSGNATVTGTAPGDITITFTGGKAATDMATLTVATGSLTAGSDNKEIIGTLTAKYPGTHGNDIKSVIRRNPLASTRTDVFIYEGSALRERYLVDNADHTDLASQINSTTNGSDLVTFSLNLNHSAYGTWTDGAKHALNAVPLGVALTGGTSGYSTVDGSVPLSTYINVSSGVPAGVLDSFQRQGGFDVFTLPSEPDRTVSTFSLLAALREWTIELNDTGQYVYTVVGGPSNEAITSAITRSVSNLNQEAIANVGSSDVRVTYPDGTQIVRSSADMTARVAGMIAASGTLTSITLRSVSTADSPVTLVNPLNRGEIEEAIANGVIVFTNRNGNIVVEDEVTSYSTFNTTKDKTFGSIRAVRTMQQIGRDFSITIDNGFVGQTSNNAATRSALLTLVADYLGNLESQGAIAPGSQVALDERFDNTGDSVYIIVNIQFARTLKRVMLTLRAPILS